MKIGEKIELQKPFQVGFVDHLRVCQMVTNKSDPISHSEITYVKGKRVEDGFEATICVSSAIGGDPTLTSMVTYFKRNDGNTGWKPVDGTLTYDECDAHITHGEIMFGESGEIELSI